MKISILKEVCKGCLYCVDVCPKKVLQEGASFNEKGHCYVVAARPEACIGCGMCTDMCPEAAIELTEGEG